MQRQDRPTDLGARDDTASTDTDSDNRRMAAGEGSHANPEVMPSIEELLKQAELAAQEHHDAWLRAKAEAENIRKRAQVDVANAHKYALESFTLKQLRSAFEKANIKEINPLGEALDPHKHQAMNTVESDATPNSIVAVFQKGYELNDRLVRPALVSVAKSKEA